MATTLRVRTKHPAKAAGKSCGHIQRHITLARFYLWVVARDCSEQAVARALSQVDGPRTVNQSFGVHKRNASISLRNFNHIRVHTFIPLGSPVGFT